MKIDIFITLKIEKCYEALACPPLPPRPITFPENLPISTHYPWGKRGPMDSPLRVGLYLTDRPKISYTMFWYRKATFETLTLKK